MENEFDFFDKLNFNEDFTKQGLGGYGTARNITPITNTIAPVTNTQTLSGIQTVAPINNIQSYLPVTPQDDNDGGGITSIPSYGYESSYAGTGTTPGENENYLKDIGEGTIDETDLEAAKKDTNINNFKNMGLFQQAFEYAQKNYGYMIANFIFPGSGYVLKAAKTTYDNKKENERLFEIQEAEKAKQLKIAQEQIRVAEEAAANRARVEAYTGQPMSDYRQSRPRSEQNYTGGDTNSNPSTPGAQDSFSNKSGMGRTGYGTGGIVTL